MNLLLLAGIGYGLFGIGLVANAFETVETDFAGFFWPQVLRGAGVMLCILPSMTIALEHRLGDDLANASAIFNLMRNLGGTIAIALVDTVLEQRTPIHVARLIARLQAGDPDAARIVGLPLDRFHNVPLGPIDEATKEQVAPMVQHAALALTINEAWLLLALLFGLTLLALPLLARRRKPIRR